MSDIVGFNSSITFTPGPGKLSLEDDFNLNNGNPPFVYKDNYDRYFSLRSQNLQLVPQDLSTFTKSNPEPIKVPKDTVITYSNDYTTPTTNYANSRTAVQVDDFDVASNNNQNVSYNAKQDLGALGKKVSNNPPENVSFNDLTAFDDGSIPLTGYGDTDFSSTSLGNANKIKINSVVDAKTNSKTNPAFTENLSKVKIDPLANELNIFQSVSYNIGLYMMNSKSYVDITKSPRTPQDALGPGNAFLLMRSGGTGVDNPQTGFSNDFFIDDLEIQNIGVGPNKFAANTNATNIRFTITEPRGVTLLERLQRLAGTVLVSTRESYIHAPYLLEIKFKGYDETGQPMPSPSAPKYIPIKITDITFEVNNSGTQYRVEAIPFANHTLGSIMNVIPHNIELKASTVGDVFSSEVTKLVQVPDRIADGVSPGVANAIGIREGQQPTKTQKTKHKNLAEILTDSRRARTKETYYTDNSGVEKAVEPAAEKHDTYNFLIAQEIADAKLNLDDIYDALNTPVPTEDEKKSPDQKKKEPSPDKKQYEAYVQGLTRGVKLDKASQTFSIAAGTDITKLINLIIMHSSYMDNNVEENPTQYLTTGNPINWFKIRPVIESASSAGGGYDRKDGRYKYSIKYVVEKNIIHYHDFPWGKKSKPVGVGYHKVYDYIFSGKNTEVLDFQLKFNTAFYQVMTAGTGSPFNNKSASSAFNPLVKELPTSAEGDSINSKDKLERQRAKDLFSSVMSDGVDLLNLDMNIVGDPAYIPTSDAYWQDKVRKGETYTTPFMPDGTINYNLTPPFIRMNLRTPVDYDATTGLQDPGRAGNSSFTGVYRITQVDSTFSGGVFQQRLSGFRPPGQDSDNLQNSGRINTGSSSNKNYLFSKAQDVIINNKQNNGTIANVVDDEFEDFDYDQPMDGVI